jgi:transposase
MSQEIRADYDQMDLLPQALEDWVPADHPARFIRAFVDAWDLAELGFGQRESEEGRPNYAADLLLKGWLYGYLARIRSPRELERACREHLSLVWLRGRHAPDHNTLWRFWGESRAALRQVFRAGVKVAAEQGLIGMICPAVEGTKLRAVASRRTMEHREELERALPQVEASIAEMEAAGEAAEREEAGEYRLPERLQEAETLRKALRESLGKMQEAKRDPLHPQEPEARRMPCEGRTEPAYNAQAGVDAQAGIIVAARAVNAESDNQLLVPMLEEVKANVGGVAEETGADGGYASAGQLGEVQTRGYEVLVAAGAETGGPDGGAYDSAQFEYAAERDEVICPCGERLKFEGWKRKGPHRPAVRLYHCPHDQECPVRALCCRGRSGRRSEWSVQHAAVMRQRDTRRDPAKQGPRRQRKVIVEPVFGILKQVEGFRRWTVRGLENVRTQWVLRCTAYNLKKLWRAWKKGLAAATAPFRSRPPVTPTARGQPAPGPLSGPIPLPHLCCA